MKNRIARKGAVFGVVACWCLLALVGCATDASRARRSRADTGGGAGGGGGAGDHIEVKHFTNPAAQQIPNGDRGELIGDVNGRLLVGATGPGGVPVDTNVVDHLATGADGTAALTSEIMMMGGLDEGGIKRTVRTDASGAVAVVQTNAAALNNTEVNSGAIRTSVEIVDDWDEGDRAKVNPIVGSIGVEGGAGASTAATQRVGIATDDVVSTGIAAIDSDTDNLNNWEEGGRAKVNLIAGSVAGVDGGAGLTTAATVRIVPATGSTTSIIGTVSLLEGTETIGSATALGRTDAGASVAVRVDADGTVRIDPTGATTQPVSDAGGTLTVDGSAGAAIQQGAGAVSAATVRFTQSTDDAGVVSLGLIDNIVHTPDSALISIAGIGAQFDDVAPAAVTENNVSVPRMSAERYLYSEIRDAAGNERGVNVTAAFELQVLASAQPGVDLGDFTLTAGIETVGSISILMRDSGGNQVAPLVNSLREVVVESDGVSITSTSTLAANLQIVAAASGLRYHGFAVGEAAVAPGTDTATMIVIHHGTLVTDPVLDIVSLSPGTGTSPPETSREKYERGLDAPNGIFLEVIEAPAGGVVFSARHRTVND